MLLRLRLGEVGALSGGTEASDDALEFLLVISVILLAIGVVVVVVVVVAVVVVMFAAWG